MTNVEQLDMIEELAKIERDLAVLEEPYPPWASRTIRARFARFHLQNPRVYDGLSKLTREAVGLGQKHWSIDAAYQVLRWSHLKTTGDVLKLNDHYRALYARLLMARNPDLVGFYRIRRRRTE